MAGKMVAIDNDDGGDNTFYFPITLERHLHTAGGFHPYVELEYLDEPYNSTRINERAVEVPVAKYVLDAETRRGNKHLDVLEIGNVLKHYYPDLTHDVIDRDEDHPGVTHQKDLLDGELGVGQYDLIISVSTLEHIGGAFEADFFDAIMTIEQYLLKPGGLLFFTVPHEQPGDGWYIDQRYLDLYDFSSVVRMDKVDPIDHIWVDRHGLGWPEPGLAYGGRSNFANTVYMVYQEKFT